jgi:hypothetical protein
MPKIFKHEDSAFWYETTQGVWSEGAISRALNGKRQTPTLRGEYLVNLLKEG